jgi:hypothetical protein
MKSPNDKQRFLERLRETPLISIAAKRAGIAKSTVYRWIKNSETFANNVNQILEEGREDLSDRVESVLIKKALGGERWAVQMWLESNRKKYIRPRTPIKTHDFDNLYDISKISVEVIERKMTDSQINQMNEKKKEEPTTFILRDYRDDNKKDDTEQKLNTPKPDS